MRDRVIWDPYLGPDGLIHLFERDASDEYGRHVRRCEATKYVYRVDLQLVSRDVPTCLWCVVSPAPTEEETWPKLKRPWEKECPWR